MFHDFKAVVGKAIGLNLLFEGLDIALYFEKIAETSLFGSTILVFSLNPADGRVVKVS